MNFLKKNLPNGLRLLIVPMKESPTVTVMVLVEAGSKYEKKKVNGVSHFLEHLCFKGTKKRPMPVDIVRELDSHGCHYNAFTGQEMTGYYAKSDRKHFNTILDVVSDIYLNSTLPESEMKKEKGVIVEEIKMYRDLPPRRIHDVLLSLLYGDQPAGWDIAGTPETVMSMTRADVSSYRDEHYVSEATVVVVAGNVDEREAEEKVAEAFSKMPVGNKKKKSKTNESQKKPRFVCEKKKTDQVHMAFGIRTCDLYHKDNYAMRVLSAILGGGMSSRLFQKMRDELGICYYISASHESFTDHGFLEINAGVPSGRLEEAARAILGELKKIKEEGVSLEELSKIKEYLTGNLYLGLESSDSIAEFFGLQEIVRKLILTEDDTAREIRAVEINDVSRVCSKYLKGANLNLAIIGETKSERALMDLLSL